MPALLAGGALGLAAGAAVSALMYFGLLTIPAGRLFQVTSGLITLLAAGMAAQAVLFLQNGGYINAMTGTMWDTSWLLKEDCIAGPAAAHPGRLCRGPDGAQILAYLATIAGILALMRMTGRSQPARRPQPAE